MSPFPLVANVAVGGGLGVGGTSVGADAASLVCLALTTAVMSTVGTDVDVGGKVGVAVRAGVLVIKGMFVCVGPA